MGDVKDSASQKAKAYQALAEKLRSRATALALPKFGGLSISEKETLAEDTDAVQPAFAIGQDDNPAAIDPRDPLILRDL